MPPIPLEAMAEKTEKATPKKLRDARKKGQVAKSQDFPGAITFVVSITSVLAMAGILYNNIAGFMIEMFRAINSNSDFESKAGLYMVRAAEIIGKSSLPIMGLVSLVGVIVNFLIIGPVFSFEPMKFDLKKLNPIEGIKQKFKLKVLVELIKSCAKILGAAIIIYLIIWASLPQIVASVAMPPIVSMEIVNNFLFDVAIRVGIFFLLIAFFDLFFQKRQFAKEMKMEKFEVKREYKDTEGDPMIKGRRREIAREIAYQEGFASAKRARAVITNPTHIAIALKYVPEEDEAPIILTMGAGELADKIINVGLENNVPIMRNIDLARELYTKGKISHYIPRETYTAVAEILKWVQALEQNPELKSEMPY